MHFRKIFCTINELKGALSQRFQVAKCCAQGIAMKNRRRNRVRVRQRLAVKAMPSLWCFGYTLVLDRPRCKII